MKSPKLNKDTVLCSVAIIISVIAYGFEKILELYITPSRTRGLVLAMFYTALLGVVIVILTHCTNSFMGLLSSLVAYKMMPVPIMFLESVSPDGSILYYLVRKASVLAFIILIYKFYNMQSEPRKIKSLPIIAMIAAVPFFKEIGYTLTSFFEAKTGSMMLGFFSQYLCYAAATALILVLAFISGYETMRFTQYFEFAALGINIVRFAGKIAVRMYFGSHISKSLYFWIAVYLMLAAAFVIATKLRRRLDLKISEKESI